MDIRSPFATLKSSLRSEGPQGASFSGMWTGRVAHVHRDSRSRLKFLFDIVPLSGWPSASDTITGGMKGVASIRMRQSFVGNLSSLSAPPSGIIVVPEVGSIVSVEMDEAGWLITGFHSGPIVAADQSIAALNEVSYNPGFEEAQPAANDDSRIPWLFGIEEGDIILGRTDSRIKLRKEGVFIGSGVECLHLYKSDNGELFERYREMERRATGRMSYHKALLGVNASNQQNSTIQLPRTDALILNTDIIESTPYYNEHKAYSIRQRGHVTKSTCDLGRKAGEILPLPSEISAEAAAGSFCIMRDTVVRPTMKPTGTLADVSELQTSSNIVFDQQVGADGSFHLRSGNLSATPGSSQLGESTQMNFELSFSAMTQDFVLKVMQGGQAKVAVKFNGLSGIASFEAENVLKLKAKQIILEADSSIVMSSSGPVELKGSNMSMSKDGIFKALQEVMAGVISLTRHTHPYTDDGNPAITSPPVPG